MDNFFIGYNNPSLEELRSAASAPTIEAYNALFAHYFDELQLKLKIEKRLNDLLHAINAYQPLDDKQGVLKDILLAIASEKI